MKKTKEAVSLIVLVLTIVIMIILTGVIVINLNNSGIIDRAKGAVSETNLKNMQELANVAWGEAYLSIKGDKTPELIKATMLEKLKGKGVSEEELGKYTFTVTTGGVEVGVNTGSGEETPDVPEGEPTQDTYSTLGELITSAADYGKTIKYEANGVTKWNIFYHTNEYVYLISTSLLTDEQVPDDSGYEQDTIEGDPPAGIWDHSSVRDLTEEEKQLWIAKYAHPAITESGWSMFKNTAKYGDNVVGAIGTPTIEMLVASWNAQGTISGDDNFVQAELKETGGEYELYESGGLEGWFVNSIDSFYAAQGGETPYYFISSGGEGRDIIFHLDDGMDYAPVDDQGLLVGGIRPVVCLKAATPARLGTAEDATHFVLKEINNN